MPAACFALQPVILEPGATSEDVDRAQHRAIVAYEAQLSACYSLVKSTPGATQVQPTP